MYSNQSMVDYKRITSPELTIKLWNAIESVGYELTESKYNTLLMNELSKQLKTKTLNTNRLTQILDNAIEDRLITPGLQSVLGFRYKPKLNRMEFDECLKDWNCFECQECNDSHDLPPIECISCFRSIHLHCIKDRKVCENFKCIYCRNLERSSTQEKHFRINTIEKPVLNRLFGYVLQNLNELKSFRERIAGNPKEICDYFVINRSDPRLQILIFKFLDLKSIDIKVRTNSYNCFREFENDFKHFLHNYIVSTVGTDKFDASLLKDIRKRFEHQISELQKCVDCYDYSNNPDFDDPNDPNKFFSYVCQPPHELVMAKVGGHPYWPCKVIDVSEDGNRYDVRFFDPQFERGYAEKKSLKPIDSKRKQNPKPELLYAFDLLDKHLAELRSKGLDFKRTIGVTNDVSKSDSNFAKQFSRKRKLESKPISCNSKTKSWKSGSQSFDSGMCSSADSTTPLIDITEDDDFYFSEEDVEILPIISKIKTEIEMIWDSSSNEDKPSNDCSDLDEMSNKMNHEFSGNSTQDLCHFSNQEFDDNLSENLNESFDQNQDLDKNQELNKSNELADESTQELTNNLTQELTDKSMQKFANKSTQELAKLRQLKDDSLNSTDLSMQSMPTLTKQKRNEELERELIETREENECNSNKILQSMYYRMDSIETNVLKKEKFEVMKEIQRLKRSISTLRTSIRHQNMKIKRQKWCQQCDKQAEYLCCLWFYYCSEECRLKDWHNSHQLICRNSSRESNE